MKVLADSSVWIDHLRHGEPELSRMLGEGLVHTHSAVIGELACGSIRGRDQFLRHLQLLPHAAECHPKEALHLLEGAKLWGLGLSWVDVLLLAACRLSHARLWTKDAALAQAANKLDVGFSI